MLYKWCLFQRYIHYQKIPPRSRKVNMYQIERSSFQEALALISEYSEAGITVRGTYVPPGKNPPEGERKLYLAIESSQELAVAKAKSEITRLIKEELLKLQTSAHHMVNKARYKVL